MSVKAPKEMITGDDFGEKRRHLLLEGKTDDSPELKALWERVYERDDYLWERYSPTLKEQYPDQWAAISLDGEWIVQRTASETLAEATARFGGANFAFGRLSEFPGHDLSRC